MEYGGSNNAMVEIALALAMGFFSLMILTMVSMQVKSGATEAEQQQQWRVSAMMVGQVNENASDNIVIELEKEDQFLIYFDGRYYNQELSVMDPVVLSGYAGRVILGVSPSLPMSEALSVRSRIDHQTLVVTTLNQEWMRALKLRGIQ